MAKKKPSKKTPTLKEEYNRKRKYYEKKLDELQSKNYILLDKDNNPFKSLRELLPKTPKRITKSSIKALERAYKERNKKLSVIDPDTSAIVSAIKYEEIQRSHAASKGALTRKIKNLEDEIRQKAKALIEEEKKNKFFENLYDEEETQKADDYGISDEDEYDTNYSGYEDDFDRDKWYEEHERRAEEETEEEYGTDFDLSEVDEVIQNALESLQNWVIPYYYNDEMVKTQSARILNAIRMLLQTDSLSPADKKKIAKKIEDNSERIQHDIDVLTMSYEDQENAAALDDLFFILSPEDTATSLEDNARINEYTYYAVGF